MEAPRNLIPVEEAYLRSLGRSAYNFAYLEWGVVWLTETITKGFLARVSTLTAGQIGAEFECAAARLSESHGDKTRLLALAASFKKLVEDRNRLMHGNPHTAESGEQRLLYDGKHGRKDWQIPLIDDFADQLAIASIEAGSLLHGGLYANWESGKPTL